ncbi:hypothetical protein DPMN_129734 [Dreissena polymorpha]|uniref:Uncharacterized protein n=1 Tax=Dreissena polymorpha TaxID=45954 RepID=A0A9D4H1Q3_DREPO|nr:hypothetical protein DPMN_129734 [Dreissena polymorpha]
MSSTRSVYPPRSRIPIPVKSVNTSAKPVRTGTKCTRTVRCPMKPTHDDKGLGHSSTGKKALSPIYSESETSSPNSGKVWKSIPLRSKQNTPRYKPSFTDKTTESTLIAKTAHQMKSETSFKSSLEPRSCTSTPAKVEFEIKVNPKYARQNKSRIDQEINKDGDSHKRTVATVQHMIENVLTSLKSGKHFAKVDISIELKPESLGSERSLPCTERRLPVPVEITDISGIDLDLKACTPRFLNISCDNHADNAIQYARSSMGPLHGMQGIAFTSRGSRFTPLMGSTPRVDELIYGPCDTITKHGGGNWIEAEIVSPGQRQLLQEHAVAIHKRPDDVPRLSIVVSPVGRNENRCIEVLDDSTDLSTDRSVNLHRSRDNFGQDCPRPMTQVRPPFVPPLNLTALEGYELHSKKKCAATFRASDSKSKKNAGTVPVCQMDSTLNKDTGQGKGCRPR